MQRSRISEASLIMDEVLLKVGKWTSRGGNWVDGQDAVEEMIAAGFGSWRETEWPGYHIKFIVQDAIEKGTLHGFKSIVEQKHYLAKGEYLWDVRLSGVDINDIYLTDCDRWGNLIKDHGGIGLIIFEAEYDKDKSGAFQKWHEQKGGGISGYVRDRIARGAPPRMRKSGFMVAHALMFFFDAQGMDRALTEGWITKVATNMRNADGSPRNPKYMLHLGEAPVDVVKGVRNYNWEPKEFDDAFGHFQQI